MKTFFVMLARAFWKDEHGFIVSAELVLVGTIAVLSMVVGLSTVSRSINNELFDIANAFDAVNQSNSVTGPSGNNGGNFTANNDNGAIVPR
jgi:Flp pilus assembly pilin Flp